MTCPFRMLPDGEVTYKKDCDEEGCALWLGDECSFKAMGRAAQQQISNADFAETVALYTPTKD